MATGFFFFQESMMTTNAEVMLSQEQVNTAMKSSDHLRAWLDASGRRWVVFNAVELVEALPWPNGVNAFMQIVMAYRDHRRGVWTGREEVQVNPLTKEVVLDRDTGKPAMVKIMKGEQLELEELDRAIRYLTSLALAKDPSWALTNPAL